MAAKISVRELAQFRPEGSAAPQLVLHLPEWRALAERLTAQGVEFVLPPSVRFQGEPGEQWTMFFRDPSGNPIEIKGFPSLDGVFAH